MKLVGFKKLADRVVPSNDEATKLFNSMEVGEEVLLPYSKIKQRSLRNHKRLFSMLKMIVDNQDTYKTVDNLLGMIKLKTGYFEIVVSHKGEQLYVPKSINFSTMKEDAFREFFSSAIDVLLEFMSEEDVESIMRYA